MIARLIGIAPPGTPEDIDSACEFLCSDKSSYVAAGEINAAQIG